MKRYDDSTILLLQCLAKKWADLKGDENKKSGIEGILDDFSAYHWSVFLFFTPAFLRQDWNEKSAQLAESVNVLINENLDELKSDFNDPANQGSMLNLSNQTPKNKSLNNVCFNKDDAGLILFILKLYPSNQNSSSLSFKLFEILYSNFFIPLYHNRNFQMAFLTYMVGSLLLMSPFLPQILSGVLGMLLASAILMALTYLVYKTFEYFSLPECRVTVSDEIRYSPSKSSY